jgi:hypothetical protein
MTKLFPEGCGAEGAEHSGHEDDQGQDVHRRTPKANGVDLEELGIEQVDDGTQADYRPGQPGTPATIA